MLTIGLKRQLFRKVLNDLSISGASHKNQVLETKLEGCRGGGMPSGQDMKILVSLRPSSPARELRHRILRLMLYKFTMITV